MSTFCGHNTAKLLIRAHEIQQANPPNSLLTTLHAASECVPERKFLGYIHACRVVCSLLPEKHSSPQHCIQLWERKANPTQVQVLKLLQDSAEIARALAG